MRGTVVMADAGSAVHATETSSSRCATGFGAPVATLSARLLSRTLPAAWEVPQSSAARQSSRYLPSSGRPRSSSTGSVCRAVTAATVQATAAARGGVGCRGNAHSAGHAQGVCLIIVHGARAGAKTHVRAKLDLGSSRHPLCLHMRGWPNRPRIS